METPRSAGEDPFLTKFGMWWSPDQDFIYISRRFYAYWETVIAGKEVVVADPNGTTRQFTIGMKHGRPAFTQGVQQCADFYSLQTKAMWQFKYDEPLTFHFRIFPEGGEEIEYPDVIHILSDTESDDDEFDQGVQQCAEFDQDNDWHKVVTKRIADGRNPLHLPARVAGRIVDTGMKRITVRLSNHTAADCEIHPCGRTKNEAYLCDGWYGLCKQLKMTPGSTMYFTFLPVELQIIMSVVRKN